jgi:putative DNA primase/helicase
MTRDRDSARGLLTSSLQYARAGWRVLPLHTPTDGRCSCEDADCSSPGKHPRTKKGLKDATTDEATIRRWWERWPDANVGILTGAPTGVFVVDVDPRHGGEESLAELIRQHGPLPTSVESLTGSGGKHVLFKHPGNSVVVRSVPRVAGLDGLDVRGDGGYIVAPPSRHASGREYAWEVSSHPDDVAIADAPDWLLRLVAQPKGAAEAGSDGDSEDDPVPEGQRNTHLTSLAGTMRRRGMKPASIFAALKEENRARCKPPLLNEEVRRIAKSVSRYQPATPPQRKIKTVHLHLTDAGNAKRLVAHHGADLRFCHQWKSWVHWDGRRWVRDVTGEVVRRAKATIRAFLHEALKEADAKLKKQLVAFALHSESAERIKAMITLAQSEPGIPVIPTDLDADPWLLNCRNGTIDLRSGSLRPHDRKNLITKLAPVDYDPDARLPEWERLLVESTGGNADVEYFLQRAVGYSVTGDTGEEKLFFVQGPGATGKSSFLEAIKAALGDYATTADFEAFLVRHYAGGPRNDIARLAGARFVVSIEVDEGKKLAEGLVKMLTGGDTVTARFLYAEAFEFRPVFKLWLAANHAPRVRDDDDAIWRRILRVPFDRVVPEEKRDPKLKALLRNPSIAGPAILAWAVRGCLAWQNQGLGVPPVVLQATVSLRNEMDPLAEFLVDRCTLDPDAWCLSKDLWAAYGRWCEENGEKWPLDRRRFAERLRARGVHQSHRQRSRVWVGVGVGGSGGGAT